MKPLNIQIYPASQHRYNLLLNYLGPSAEKKLFAMSIDVKFSKVRQTLILHSSQESPIVEVNGITPYKTMAPTFSCPVGRNGKETHREIFQWRSSAGKEIKDLAGYSRGWKLVRLSQTVDEAGGSRSQRGMGCSSDRREIVAVIAHNTSWSLTKGFQFTFLGSGLSALVGEEWEIMAIITGVQLWAVDFQVMHDTRYSCFIIGLVERV
ncbi:hypothetical protein BBP40_002724 [Aspergillus hancockii]|nr:hypothetical protein BBP40_002724 [Aspergillus hancockii]